MRTNNKIRKYFRKLLEGFTINMYMEEKGMTKLIKDKKNRASLRIEYKNTGRYCTLYIYPHVLGLLEKKFSIEQGDGVNLIKKEVEKYFDVEVTCVTICDIAKPQGAGQIVYIKLPPRIRFWKLLEDHSIEISKNWKEYPGIILIKDEKGDVVMEFDQKSGKLNVSTHEIWEPLQKYDSLTDRGVMDLIKKEIKKHFDLKKMTPKNTELTFKEKLKIYLNFKRIKPRPNEFAILPHSFL